MSDQRDTVWVDASSGASGDMLLGALVGAGVPLGVLADAVDKVAPGELVLTTEEVLRGGFAATKVDVARRSADIEPTSRTWSDIEQLLGGAGLHEDVRSLAHDVFARLAEAEARVHGSAAADVHFHEVGALDAIADVVGVCAGFVHLGEPRVVVSPVAVGGGTIESEHGRLPIPAPAVVELLRDVPSYGGVSDAESGSELCTPTGAALLTTLADSWGSQPTMSVGAVGIGAGARDRDGRANVLRMLVGRPFETGLDGLPQGPERSTRGGSDAIFLETNVDDLDPRIWPVVIGELLEAGASDAWLTPIVMKKGRPAHTLSVLVAADRVDVVRNEVYRQTSTIGMREQRVDKHALDREMISIEVEGHRIAVKLARLDGPGSEVVNVQPEFDDVVAAAERLGRPVKDVMALAVAATHGLA